MTDRLAILIWAATPDRPELVVTPLVHALAARALDAEVEVHFAGPAVRWLLPGVAEVTFAGRQREKSVADWLAELRAAGVTLFACSMACAAWLQDAENLPEAVRQAGATAFVGRTLEASWQTLVF